MDIGALLEAVIIAAIVCAIICAVAWALVAYVVPAPAHRFVWLVAILLCVLVVLRWVLLSLL